MVTGRERPRLAQARCAANGHWENDPIGARIREQMPLLRMWARRQYRIRYRQSALGWMWSLAQPLAMLAIYGLVLSVLLKVRGNGLPYVSFAFAGLVPWAFLSSAISAAIPATGNARDLISRTYFPREVIPAASVGAALVDLAVGSLFLLILDIAQNVGLAPTVSSLLIIDVILAIWVTGIAILGAVVAVFVRDALHALPLGLQLLFIATPIMYPVTLLPTRWRWVENLNPLAVVVQATRAVVLRHQWPDWPVLAAQFVAGGLFLLASILYTRSVEPRIPDVA